MDYKKLLKKGMSELPDSIKKTDRFEIPKIRGHIQGNKTVISNFFQIASALDRDENQFLKYLLKELATPGESKKPLVILGRKISASRINEKIHEYADKFVKCKQCEKYDSKLVKKGRISMLNCYVCGAKYPI